MSAHDLAPVNSILGIIYGILGLLNVSNSLAHVPSGTCLILALIDAQQSLMHVLSNSIPSESGKDSSLVQSDWLSLLITLLLAFNSFGHGSFCIFVSKNRKERRKSSKQISKQLCSKPKMLLRQKNDWSVILEK